jgi:hypothetical protein
MIAAATKYENNGKHDSQTAIILKEMAEAIIIHICSSKMSV